MLFPRSLHLFQEGCCPLVRVPTHLGTLNCCRYLCSYRTVRNPLFYLSMPARRVSRCLRDGLGKAIGTILTSHISGCNRCSSIGSPSCVSNHVVLIQHASVTVPLVYIYVTYMLFFACGLIHKRRCNPPMSGDVTHQCPRQHTSEHRMLHGSKTLDEPAGLGGLKRWEKRSGVRTAGRGDAPPLREDVDASQNLGRRPVRSSARSG